MHKLCAIPKTIVITYGPDVEKVIQKANENDYELWVVNARFFKPLDTKMIDELTNMNLPIFVFETDCKIGSLSSAILEYLNENESRIHILGIDDHYVCHGSIRALRIQEHINTESLFEAIDRYGNDAS